MVTWKMVIVREDGRMVEKIGTAKLLSTAYLEAYTELNEFIQNCPTVSSYKLLIEWEA